MNEKHKLPEGWKWVNLGEVIADAQSGFAIGERDPNGVIQLRMNNVDTRGRLNWSEFIRVPASQDDIEKYRLLPGDVVFNNTNSTELVGKSAQFMAHDEPIVYSNHFTRIRTLAEHLDSSYLSSWLLHQWQVRVFENLCNRWIGQSAVKNDKLLALEIPLPPLPEQKRIAAILNEQMEAVQKAREATQAQLEAAKSLPAAYLRQVFPRPGEELPEGWRWVKLGELCEKNTGTRDPRMKPDKSFLYVDITSVDNIKKAIGTTKIIQGRDSPSRARKVIYERDVIISTTRPNLNAVAIVPSYLDNQICSTGFCVLRTTSELDCDYLFLFVKSTQFIKNLSRLVTGALYPAVTDKQVFSDLIPLPPLSEQKRIAAILNEQMEAVGKVRTAVEGQLEHINTLPASLLRRAFSGALQ